MIKDKEIKKTKVCNECITMMSEKDFEEHDGKCQLCRGEVGSLQLWYIYYFDGDEQNYEHKVYDGVSSGDVCDLFTEEHREEYGLEDDWEFESIDAYPLTRISVYNINVTRRD